MTGDSFDRLKAGHRSLAIDFRTDSGRAELAALLGVADIVIESSRPRALANLGLAPEAIGHPDGQVWLSTTGYGRSQPDLVAFGDDAAVAGGFVGWDGCEPVFCADAIADPLTGACGALAIAELVAAGGGQPSTCRCADGRRLRGRAAAGTWTPRRPSRWHGLAGDLPAPGPVTGSAAPAPPGARRVRRRPWRGHHACPRLAGRTLMVPC